VTQTAKVLWGGRAYDIDSLVGKFELTSGLMGGWPVVNQHDRIFFGERGGSLSHQVTFTLLAPCESPCGYVFPHHGAFLPLVPNGVRIIGTGCLEKLLKVISRLPHLALEVVLCRGDEHLIRVTNLLVVVILVTASGDHDSLESLFRPPLAAFGALLCALVGCLERCPLTAVVGRFPAVLDENDPECLLARGVPGGNVKELLHGLRLVTAEFMH
jgi:hypothetical protein